MIGNVNQPSTHLIMDVDGTLKAGAVDVAAVLASNVVETAQIADDAVTLAKLQNITRGSIIVGGTSDAPTLLDASDIGQILIGNGSDLNSMALSGDATLSYTGALTIVEAAITNTKLATDVKVGSLATLSTAAKGNVVAAINELANEIDALVAPSGDSVAEIVAARGGYTTLDERIDTLAVAAGLSGGQTINGGTAANDDLTLQGTTDATRTTSYVNLQPNGGLIKIGSSAWIEAGTSRLIHMYKDATANGQNLFIGDDAGNYSLSPAGGAAYLGSTNTGVGYRALQSLTTGYHNTALGADALRANTTGVYNTALGVHALLYNTTGSDNTAIGPGALQANTTASFNVAIGLYPLTTNTTGEANVAIGSSPLRYNTSGSNNVAIGTTALQANTTGNSNVAIGSSALAANTTGVNNVAIGNIPLADNTTGTNNIAIGGAALNDNTEGNTNVAIGYLALWKNTTASDNVALGSSALAANTTGASNLAIGTGALAANTTAVRNVAIGTYAMTANTTGGYSVAIGQNALTSHQTGNFNTAIGSGALYTNATGASNVAIGNSAGYYETGSNKLFIDNAPRASEADGRTKALIYGVFDAAVANQELTFNAGKMGFFGTAAVAKPTGVAVDAAGIHAALVTLGLIAA